MPPDEGKAGDVSLARQEDEEAELLAEVEALSGSDDESKWIKKNRGKKSNCLLDKMDWKRRPYACSTDD